VTIKFSDPGVGAGKLQDAVNSCENAFPYHTRRPVRKFNISLPNQSPGKETQDFLTKPAFWSAKSRYPYQTGHLVRKIVISLPNQPSGKENLDFLTKPAVR